MLSLNNSAGFVRWTCIASGAMLLFVLTALGAGIVTSLRPSAAGAAPSAQPAATPLFALAGAALAMVLMVVVVVVSQTAETRLRDTTRTLSTRVVSGHTSARYAPARVVRRVRAKGHPAFVLSSALPCAGPADFALLTTLPADGPARRSAALVPAAFALAPGAAALVALSPENPDVAVLEDRVTPAQLTDVAADPRWGAERLPTTASISGGPARIALWLLIGAAIGCALALVSMQLLGQLA